jgi:hypothetical protein
MKQIFKYFILVNLLCGFNSCDILEENPKDFVSPQNFFNTEDEVTSALYGVYECMHNTYVGDTERILLGDLGVDILVCRDQPHKNVYQHYLMDTPTVEMSDMWRAYYTGIGAANMVIDRTKSSELSPDFKNKIISEAKVLRAFFYHGLIMIWGDVPMWLEELDLGKVSSLARTSKQDIVNQLYQDLDFAVKYLPETYESIYAGRLTSWAAKALWARIALLNNDWQKAYELSSDIINNSSHKLLSNYEDVFNWKNKFNNELIWVIPCLTDIQGSTIHSFASPRGRDESAVFNLLFSKGLKALRPDGVEVSKSEELFEGWGMFCVSETYLSTFEEGDTRKKMMDWSSLTMSDGTVVKFNGGDGGGKGHYTLKWSAFGEKANNGSRDIHHIRLGEIYLIQAESANELNKSKEAIGALNALRERAFGNTNHNYSQSLSKDAIKSAIVNEHKWELGGEGVRRWYLNHWGFEYLKAAVESLKNENPKAAANIKEHHVLFKIPAEEFVKNPNLGSNNPGY